MVLSNCVSAAPESGLPKQFTGEDPELVQAHEYIDTLEELIPMDLNDDPDDVDKILASHVAYGVSDDNACNRVMVTGTCFLLPPSIYEYSKNIFNEISTL